MLNDDHLKIAIDDARARQIALIQLIYLTDQQAMGLLRLYVTIGLATATGSAAAISGKVLLPFTAVGGLIIAALFFLIGCFYCFRAMQTIAIGLPGRGAEFWLWSINSDGVDFKYTVTEYLGQLQDKQERDKETNNRTAAALKYAKWAGAAALAVSLLSTVVAAAPLVSTILGFC